MPGKTKQPFAESEGFEPPVPLGTTVFKTAAFDHSANSPERDKSRIIFKIQKAFREKKLKNDEKKKCLWLFF